MAVKISRFEIENVKRVKAVTLEPNRDGLTVIGGRNEQGKTSILDAIAWTLGGYRFKPDAPARDGSAVPPKLHVTLSNGLVVERKGAASSLKVTDPAGNKGGQQLLNEFIEALALDLPRFLAMSGKDKAKTLLQIVGVEGELDALEAEEARLYNERRTVGQIAEQKRGAAEEAVWYADAPTEVIPVADLAKHLQEAIQRNAENARVRASVATLQERHANLEAELAIVAMELETATQAAKQAVDVATDEIEDSIANAEEANEQVRANNSKAELVKSADEAKAEYEMLSRRIEEVRSKKIALLEGANLPLPDLGVKDGELTYRGHKWGDMSGSGQLKVATAIVRKLNPECGFVLLDKLEQMDLETLAEFGAWLEAEGLQVIATRVSTGDECEIVIEDGYVAPDKGKGKKATGAEWKEGEF